MTALRLLIASLLAPAAPLFAQAEILPAEIVPVEAQTALPEAVQAMVEDAFANGSDAELAAVVKYARRVAPAHGDALAARLADHRAVKRRTERERLAQAGTFDNWSGRGEIGGSRSTGNVDTLGLFASLNLTRQGVDWRHLFRSNLEVQETNGFKTRERLLAAYEPNYKVSERVSTYGLLQYERDPFLGYDARFSASGGLGLALIRSDAVTLDVQGGPAYRHGVLTAGGTEDSLSGRAALDAKWKLADGIAFTQTASAFLESRSNTLTATTGVEAQLIGALSARLSYNVQHETQPPLGRLRTDTLSRVTLVYGF